MPRPNFKKQRYKSNIATINRFVLNAFLEKTHENFEWMKKLPQKAVDAELALLKPAPDFGHRDLRLHQKIGFLLCLEFEGFYLQFGLGSGKTRLMLEVLYYKMMYLRSISRVIVLAPTDTIASGWGDQIREWLPDLPYRVLVGSSEDKRAMLGELNRGVFIATYLGFAWLMAELQDVQKAGKPVMVKGKPKRELVLVNSMVDAMASDFDVLVCDEATAISNRESIFFRALKRMRRTVPSAYLLAGRSFGSQPTDTWSQYYVVDKGETLGETLGMFRGAFCIEKPQAFGAGYDYVFDKTKADLLNTFLANRALHFPTEECIQLPALTRAPRYCSMPEGARAYYEAIRQRRRDADLPPDNNFLRLRQLASGYLGIRDKYDTKVEVRFPDNPKIELMLDVLRDLPKGDQVLIFHEFTLTGQMICEALARHKIKHGWVYGGTSTQQYERDYARFKAENDFHLVLNSAKGARGLNLQKANYLIVVESPTDPEIRDNMIKRISRDGQLKKCFVIDLIMRNTVDESILASITEGNNLYKQVMKSPHLLYA